ncbi:Phosphatidylserine synthase 2 isoform A [Chlorella sorokiniana]|nr:Phosphatidylserine synthase 2 isoform A [Chlorella sorokiniana]|eukprot:PRW57106.1 Phosphatidylserine synthase 2 isoform A [Chlorella sorokiniana]
MAPRRQPASEKAMESIDPRTRFLYTPHTVTFLLLGLAVLIYVAHPFHPDPRPADPEAAAAVGYLNAKTGIWAIILVFLGYSVVQGPTPPMVRPHPAFWRLVHGIMVVYLLFMVYMLMQNVHDARQFLKHLYPELGVELPERHYGTDCRLWVPGEGVNWKVIHATVWDEFVLAHTLGWWGKALFIRNYTLLWFISIAFELCEKTLQHWLPNFNECWWDSWLLDVAICNAIGIYTGMWTVRYFKSKQYNWSGISQQPSLLAKAKRGLMQFTPYSWDNFEWQVFSSPKRCLQCLFICGVELLFEVNHFFLKALLWVPPTNPLNTYRLTITFLIALPGFKEYYEFIEQDGSSNPFTKLGTFAWLALAIALVETLVCIKFGKGLFPQPWPREVVLAWSIAGSIFAVLFGPDGAPMQAGLFGGQQLPGAAIMPGQQQQETQPFQLPFGGAAQLPFKRSRQADLSEQQQQAGLLRLAQPSMNVNEKVAVPKELLVEFTAPGLRIPLRQALDMGYVQQPAEAALLDLLPPPEQQATFKTSSRPSLASMLRHYEKKRQQDVADTAAAAGDTAADGADTAASAGGGAAAQQVGSVPQRVAADLANELQFTLQQAEEAALREKRAAEEQEAEEQEEEQEEGRRHEQHRGSSQGGNGADGQAAGDEDGSAFQDLSQALLKQGIQRKPLALGANHVQPAVRGSQGSTDAGSAAAAGSGVRMLVGVVSACCTEKAAERRAILRDTWARTIQESHPGINLRFFLAQPPDAGTAARWLPALQAELERHNDTVVLRGEDTYKNLPNKTLRLLRYALAHPAGYTHVMKTDDDCYVRISKVVEALSDPPQEPPAGTLTLGGAPKLPLGLHRRHLLPATLAQLRDMAGRDGSPLHTDGMQLVNMTKLVRQLGAAAGRTLVDDAEGRATSLAQIEQNAKVAQRAQQAALQLAEQGREAEEQQQAVQEQQQGLAKQVVAAAGGAGGRGSGRAGGHKLLPPRMTGVYLGCLENKGGFFPIRDQASKWYVPYEELPDESIPFAVKYLAGWGVVLSRDLATHAVSKANLFQRRPELAPAWFGPLAWEDVMLGLLLEDVADPQDHFGFRPAWRACPADTAVKHLDVDAPRLFRGLYEQDVSGLWDDKPVQCASGDYLVGDYAGWKAWRDQLPTVERV